MISFVDYGMIALLIIVIKKFIKWVFHIFEVNLLNTGEEKDYEIKSYI